MYTVGEIYYIAVVGLAAIACIFVGYISWDSYNKWIELERFRHSRNTPSKT